MAVVDVANRTISLKIVYYGCALGGKTTNLIRLHGLTDPDGNQGLVSIATQDDRTLFFDLLPLDLGRVGGLSVKVKVYTVPGQVHYELTRRQVLGGADAVVFVADSDPEARTRNTWALENVRLNLRSNGLDPDTIPLVMQWNKRDLPDARPVSELEAELNPRHLPSLPSVATTGEGVLETFASILKIALVRTYSKSSRSSIDERTIRATVDKALEQAASAARNGDAAAGAAFDHRFDMEKYRDQQAEKGRDKRIIDQESLFTEALNSNMKLAEKLHEYRTVEAVSDRRADMMTAMGRLAPLLADPANPPVPPGMMELLLAGAGRHRGSVLLFKGHEKVMEERQVFPAGPDPLNHGVAGGLGSVAFRFSRTDRPRVVEDLQSEVFFDDVPSEAEGLAGAMIAPLQCDGLSFGAMWIYARISDPGFDASEREYWHAASTFISLALHWRALRKKVLQAKVS